MTDPADALSTFRAMCAALTGPGSSPFGELSALIALLNAEAGIARAHHWQSRGAAFYSDHEMYGVIYDKINAQVDGLAERAVGLSSEVSVQPVYQAEAAQLLISKMYNGSRDIFSPEQMATASLTAARTVLDAIALCIKGMTTRGSLTIGLENLLQTYADEQEQFIYFLRQRLTD